MKVVVDASVAVKWIIPEAEIEPDSDRAARLLSAVRDNSVEPVQPPHWLAEVAAVLCRLRPEVSLQGIDLLDALDLPVVADAEIYRLASRIAVHTREHLFDTLYHAVALERDAVLVTADDRYLRKARALGKVMSLTEWRLPAPRTNA